jgi:2'-5' RNA ligase
MQLKGQTEIYRRNWVRFYDTERIFESKGDFKPHAAVLVRIKPSLWMPVQKLQGSLEEIEPDHEYLHPLVFHLSLKYCGNFDDEISEEIIPDVADACRRVLTEFHPFEVTLKGLNVFCGCVFIQVFSPDGTLYKLHNALQDELKKIAMECPKVQGKNFIPHVTIVTLNHRPNEMFKALRKYRDVKIGEMIVDTVELVKGIPHLTINRIKTYETFPLR